MRTIGVVTVARSDYGIYLPVLRQIQADPTLDLRIIASGAHLVPSFGQTVDAIEADGFEIAERVEMLLASDSPEAIAKGLALGIAGFASVFARWKPDVLLVLGDRFEMCAAALAALPFKIPVAHIHGGELTFGAIDDALRHSITKLSHLHFVATQEYARRVTQLGEEPWRITVSGAPALDHVAKLPKLSRAELEEQCGIRLDPAPLLVTYHPVTLEFDEVESQINELLGAVAEVNLPVVFTMPNADTRHGIIRRRIAQFTLEHAAVWVVENLGTVRYFNLMRYAAAMVGNSSSGLIEAPSMQLPVVNVGSRQAGRQRAGNVIDVPCSRSEISAGIRRATSPDFRVRLKELSNPYGSGGASERIVGVLRTVVLDDGLVRKLFADLEARA